MSIIPIKPVEEIHDNLESMLRELANIKPFHPDTDKTIDEVLDDLKAWNDEIGENLTHIKKVMVAWRKMRNEQNKRE